MEEILYDEIGDSQRRHVSRRCFRERLNSLDQFSDREFLVRYRFTKATAASILLSVPGAGLSGPAALTDAAASRWFELLWCRDVPKLLRLPCEHASADSVPGCGASFSAPRTDPLHLLGEVPGRRVEI